MNEIKLTPEERILALEKDLKAAREEIKNAGKSTHLSTGIKTLVYIALAFALVSYGVAAWALVSASGMRDVAISAGFNASSAMSTAADALRKAEAAENRAEQNYHTEAKHASELRSMVREMKSKFAKIYGDEQQEGIEE